MNDIILDFETRSKIDLKKVGQSVYSHDPSTEVLCLCWAVGDEYPRLWTPDFDEGIRDLFELISHDDSRFIAHNASFEISMWENHCVPRLGWPKVHRGAWDCTAARAAAVGLPRGLDKAGKALGLATEKDNAGHRLMLKLCKPRKPTKHDVSEWHEKADQLESLYGYCRQDVFQQRLLHERLPELSKREKAIWRLDLRINEKGLLFDMDTIKAALRMEALYKAELEEELSHITRGEITSGGQVARIVKFCAENGLNISNLQVDTVDMVLESDESNQKSVPYRVLEIRQALSKASIKKYLAMLQRSDADGRLRGSHLYYGAHTGRWASKGVQTHNLIKGDLPPKEIDLAIEVVRSGEPELAEILWDSKPRVLSGLLRSMIIAPEGKRLIVCDYSAIEARVLAWLAQQTDLVDDFRNSVDAYKKMAVKIYKVCFDDVTDFQRYMAKQVVLGFGYQMGGPRFVAQMAQAGVEITEEFAEEVKVLYRKANKWITRWWYALHDAAIDAIETGKPKYANSIRFRVEDRFLKALLPSGREICYCDPIVHYEDWIDKKGNKHHSARFTHMVFNKGRWFRDHPPHGGKLAENIVQGVSRDLLASAMLRLENYGYTVVGHVHDEVICEEAYGFGSIEAVEKVMCILPVWAKGCPIAAEGFETERYRK